MEQLHKSVCSYVLRIPAVFQPLPCILENIVVELIVHGRECLFFARFEAVQKGGVVMNGVLVQGDRSADQAIKLREFEAAAIKIPGIWYC